MNTMFKTKKGPNGFLPIEMGWKGRFRQFKIAGGPYGNFPGKDKAFGVCVRAEAVIPGSYHVHLPIRDFDIPKDDSQVEDAIKDTLRAALQGNPIYVGCMGGWGRTGLFLALIAKAVGIENPIEYVRKHYTPRAVETAEQEDYVEQFDVSRLQKWFYRASWLAAIPFLRKFI